MVAQDDNTRTVLYSNDDAADVNMQKEWFLICAYRVLKRNRKLFRKLAEL